MTLRFNLQDILALKFTYQQINMSMICLAFIRLRSIESVDKMINYIFTVYKYILYILFSYAKILR